MNVFEGRRRWAAAVVAVALAAGACANAPEVGAERLTGQELAAPGGADAAAPLAAAPADPAVLPIDLSALAASPVVQDVGLYAPTVVPDEYEWSTTIIDGQPFLIEYATGYTYGIEARLADGSVYDMLVTVARSDSPDALVGYRRADWQEAGSQTEIWTVDAAESALYVVRHGDVYVTLELFRDCAVDGVSAGVCFGPDDVERLLGAMAPIEVGA